MTTEYIGTSDFSSDDEPPYRHFKEAHTQAEIYDSLAEIVEESETNESVEATEGEVVMLPEYAKLYEQNSDIVGWIRIDDTQMNYPVMQSPQEPNFYLKHGFDKEYTDYGCPYMSEKNTASLRICNFSKM